MLKTPKTQCPYIGTFKLSSGEEFICKVVEETDTSYAVLKPLCLVSTQQGVQFAPLLLLGSPDERVHIPKPVIHSLPAESQISQYESMTSGIALPKKSSIIT